MDPISSTATRHPTQGVPLAEASARSGYSSRQILYMITCRRIRYLKRGGRVYLHPADVDALASQTWQGAAVPGAADVAAPGPQEG